MHALGRLLIASSLLVAAAPGSAGQDAAAGGFDAVLAERLGADERGMRNYVLVTLKSGPTPVTDPQARKELFAGHFANMQRLSDAGSLVLAGPFAKNDDGWRGLFVLAVDDIEQARAITATDPVIESGEMVADYHGWYGSAAVMMIPEIHKRLTPPE